MKIDENNIEKIEKNFYKDKKEWDLFLTNHFVKRVKERVNEEFSIEQREMLKEQIKSEMEKYFVDHPIDFGYEKNFKSTRMELFGRFVRVFFHLELNPNKIWNVIVTTITRKESKKEKRIRKNIKSKRKFFRKNNF